MFIEFFFLNPYNIKAKSHIHFCDGDTAPSSDLSSSFLSFLPNDYPILSTSST